MRKLSKTKVNRKYPAHELKNTAAFECGLCGERLGGGRGVMITHAALFHYWQVKLVQDNATYLGQMTDHGTGVKFIRD